MQKSKRVHLTLMLISFLFIMGNMIPVIINSYQGKDRIDYSILKKASYTISGQIMNSSYTWYLIPYSVGDLIKVNASSNNTIDFVIGVIITDRPQPHQHIGSTLVLAGGLLNRTQNVTLSYINSDIFQEWYGLYLLVISLNDSNPALMNYTLTSSHSIIPYTYDQYYNEKYLPVFVIIVVIVIGVAAIVTAYFLKKWRQSKSQKLPFMR